MKKYVLPFVMFFLGICVCVIVYINFLKPPKECLGERVVNYLYNYENLYNLSDNDKLLKDVVTEKVYKKISPTGKFKAMNTYLKLGDSCKVNILDKEYSRSGGYVTYTLKCDRLSTGRIFMFRYKITDGKISSVKEYEALPFKEE